MPLEALVAASGVELRKAGADLVGRCPFHDDREPSPGREPGEEPVALPGGLPGRRLDDRLGDAVQGRELPPRRRAAARRAGPAAASTAPPRPAPPSGACPRLSSATPATPRPSPRSSSTTTPRSLGSPEALAYLRSRRIDDPEAIEVFKLGHANRTLSYRLPTKERKDGAELRGRLQRLGVFRASGHEHFNGCVVVPICDSTGAVVEMYGRKLDWDPRTGQPAHLYLPGPHRGVWNERRPRRRRSHPLRVAHRRPQLLVRRAIAT